MLTTLAVDESEEKESVADFLAEVDQLSEERNLLALNAVFEAARLGETGRHVADEVKQFLSNSNKLNNEIKNYAIAITDKIKQGMEPGR